MGVSLDRPYDLRSINTRIKTLSPLSFCGEGSDCFFFDV